MNIEELKVKENLRNYLEGKGLDLRKNIHCPSPAHEDKNASAKFYADTNTIYCYGCGKHFDIFNVIGFDYGLDKKEAYKKGMEMYGDKVKSFNNKGEQKIMRKVENETQEQEKNKIDYTNEFTQWHKDLLENEQGLGYLSSRGISKETAIKYNLGYNKEYQNIILPTSNYSFAYRSINQKKYRKQGTVNLFNQSALFNNKNYCFIAEGEFDCLSFLELGYNAIGLGSMVNYQKVFINELEKDKVYILALDNDKAGQDTTAEMIKEFKARNLRYLAFNWTVPYKDPNEYLTTDAEGFKSVCESVLNNFDKLLEEQKSEEQKEQEIKELEELKEYNLNNALNKILVLNQFIDDTKDFTPYATGFTTLDNCLNGGLYSGLTIFGAPSSTGKTTFALQLADTMAKNGNDILYYSLEMPTLELMCKSLSRISFENVGVRRAKTMDEILYGFHYKQYSEETIKDIEECKIEYAKFADNIFIKEEMEDISQIYTDIEKHIKFRKKKPIVFLDYLQIVPRQATDKKMDTRSIVDENVTELKRIARKYNIAIFSISSVNRQSYKNEMDMSSFKESGGIEFGADVLIGLQFTDVGKDGFDFDEAKQQDPRQITLSILKNRNGITGKNIDFEYKAKYNHFQEKGGGDYNIRRTESKSNFYKKESEKKFSRKRDTSLFEF